MQVIPGFIQRLSTLQAVALSIVAVLILGPLLVFIKNEYINEEWIPNFEISQTNPWHNNANFTFGVTISEYNSYTLLEEWSYYLYYPNGTLYQGGEIDIQQKDGQYQGILDMNRPYRINSDVDPKQAKLRMMDVANGSQTDRPGHLNEGAISVSFMQFIGLSAMSASDMFNIRGNTTNHTASAGYIFEVRYDGDHQGYGKFSRRIVLREM